MASAVRVGPARDEVPYTLEGEAPKVLSFWDQSAFWANLGVSLLAFSGASTVLALTDDGRPTLSIAAGIAAMVVGTVVGGLMLGLAAVPGARTGAPAMVLLRGLFGTRLSYVPTVLNILQLVGWGTFELITIGGAAKTIFHGGPHWLYVVVAGILTTVLTIWPLGSVRLLRRFVTIAVVVSLGYYYVELVRRGLPDLTKGGTSGFWLGADAALAVSISWVPVAADYTRHSRSPRAAFGAASVAYGATQIVAYVLGLFALALVGMKGDPFQPFLDVPLGVVFFGIFVLREVDQSFANVYSTAVSVQNLAPKADRRVLTVGLGVLTTVLALTFNMGDYANFLTIIGAVFVPMLGVLAVDFFLLSKGRAWDMSASAPSRWGMIVAWAAGFAVYQLINPGRSGRLTDGWVGMWTDVRDALHFQPQTWMSASLASFAVAAVAAALIGRVTVLRRRTAA